MLKDINKFSEKGIKTSKGFWKFIEPFMSNKCMIANNDITLIDKASVITDEYQISKTFNKHYINIAGKSCGNKPNNIGTTLGTSNDSDARIYRIIESYQNHSPVFKI